MIYNRVILLIGERCLFYKWKCNRNKFIQWIHLANSFIESSMVKNEEVRKITVIVTFPQLFLFFFSLFINNEWYNYNFKLRCRVAKYQFISANDYAGTMQCVKSRRCNWNQSNIRSYHCEANARSDFQRREKECMILYILIMYS